MATERKYMSNAEYADDLLIFTLLKIKVYQKEGSLKDEYKSILSYEKIGGTDNQILNMKIAVEEALFLRYVKMNK